MWQISVKMHVKCWKDFVYLFLKSFYHKSYTKSGKHLGLQRRKMDVISTDVYEIREHYFINDMITIQI